jgi:hypothetical protein
MPPGTVLCQGDVVIDFAYPVLSNIQIRKRDFVGELRIKTGPLAIVSHDCDLELYDGVPKRIAIQVCPSNPIPRQLLLEEEALARLKSNRVVPETPEYINLFFFQACVGILEEDMVADLSVVHSLPSSPALLRRLLDQKKLELTREAQNLFQEKLMCQYGRDRPKEPSE